jgi:hypothetical protein
MSAAPKQTGDIDNGPAEGKALGQLTAYIETLTRELQEMARPGSGGVLSPAIYDTAQLLRYAPPASPAEVERLVLWLLEQQQPDGGWGGAEAGDDLPRHVPTLAAVLALHEKAPASRKKDAEAAMRRGIGFLNRTSGVWRRGHADSLPDDIPVAAELTLPLLLDEAAQAQGKEGGELFKELSQEPFKALRDLGDRRKKLIGTLIFMAPVSQHKEGKAPMHTWEAWDRTNGPFKSKPTFLKALARPNRLVDPNYKWVVHLKKWMVLPAKWMVWAFLMKKRGTRPGADVMDIMMDVVDGSGGVGHSVAATAMWLKALRQKRERARERELDKTELEESATKFLEAASKATLTDIPGVAPTVWPINRFEQSWALFSLYVLGLLDETGPLAHPKLVEAARPHLEDLRKEVNENNGLGMSDHFVCDGDITATTISLLIGTNHSAHLDRPILERFKRGKQHFITYDYELQPSVTTTAHATMAFSLVGWDSSPLVELLLNWQNKQDHRWRGDKWHKSWLYTTAQVMLALAWADKKRSVREQKVLLDSQEALRKGRQALLAAQFDEGGWGFNGVPTLAETAYAVQALYGLKGLPLFEDTVKTALRKAAQWMKAEEATRQAAEDAARQQNTLEAYHAEYWAKKERYWIGKELYCPYRVDRVFELSALVALVTDPELKSSP